MRRESLTTESASAEDVSSTSPWGIIASSEAEVETTAGPNDPVMRYWSKNSKAPSGKMTAEMTDMSRLNDLISTLPAVLSFLADREMEEI